MIKTINSLKGKFSLTVTLLIIFTATISFSYGANYFSDVSDSYWANQYITFNADKGIINGFTDGTFRPAEKVTKEQSLTMLYRSIYAITPDIKNTNYTEKYSSLLIDNKISDWAHEYVGYAIESNIVDIDEISTMTIDYEGQPATRQEVAVWSAKAMSVSASMDSDVSYYLDYDEISEDAKDYIHIMYQNKIMMGDPNGNFRPKDTITRAEFAAVTSRVYTYLEQHKYSAYTYLGTLNIEHNAISIINSDNLVKILDINSETVYIHNGNNIAYDALPSNDEVLVAYNSYANPNKLFIWNEEIVLNGTVISQQSKEEYNLNLIEVQLENNATYKFEIADFTMLYDENNNVLTNANELINKEIKFHTEGLKIVELKIIN